MSKLEKIEDQLVQEAKALDAEMKRLRDELAHAAGERGTAIKAAMDKVEEKAQSLQDKVKAEGASARKETDTKIGAMQDQLKRASDTQKAEIEKHVAEAKAEYEKQKAKLEQANEHIRKALRR